MSEDSDKTSTLPVATATVGDPHAIGPGDVLANRYAIEHLVGEGMFGAVYAAIDLTTDPPRRVAIKVLRREHAAEQGIVSRFERRELGSLLRVHARGPTPNVVRALEPEVGTHGELRFLVLELIEGPSLREVLDRDGALGPARALSIGGSIARGLAAIHAAGGVHRDLKPTNIRLRGDEEPVILDLGTAKALWETQEATGMGPMWMTPRYAAPEQRAGLDVGPGTDVYALGLILREMLSGSLSPPRVNDSNRGLVALIERCLAQEPARRPTAAEVERALSALLEEISHVRVRRAKRPLRQGVLAPAVLAALSLWLADSRVGTPDGSDTGWELRWSKRFGDENHQSVEGLAVDGAGNTLVVGSFKGKIDFGDGPLVSAGNWDVFVAKLDRAGNPLWSKRFGDGDRQIGSSIAVSPTTNDIAVGGAFFGRIDLGNGPLFNPADSDPFVAKLDPAGNPLWSKRFGDAAEQSSSKLAMDAAGNTFVAGNFHGAIDFGGGPLESAGFYDVYLAKLDPAGNPLWSRRFGDPDEQAMNAMDADAAGNTYLTGQFRGAIDLGAGPLQGTDDWDAFVARLDPEGRAVWSKRLGGARFQTGIDIAGVAGGIVLAGYFEGTLDLGTGTLESAGGREVFVVRLDAEGHPVWSRRFGDGGNDAVRANVSGADGDVILTWVSQGTNGSSTFVIRLDAAGNPIASHRIRGAVDHPKTLVAVAPDGDLILAKSFEGSIDPGGGPLTSAGGTDLLLARFTGTTACPRRPPGEGPIAWYPLDERGGSLARDCGRNNHGTFMNGPAPATGRLGGARWFDGVDDYVEAPYSAALDVGTGDFSLTAWIRTADADDVKVILDRRIEDPAISNPKDDSHVQGYVLFLYNGGLTLQLADGRGKAYCSPSQRNVCTSYLSGRFVADDQWHFVAVTVRRGDREGGVFYVDGEAGRRFDPTVRSRSLDSITPLRIGSRSSSMTALFRGMIDDVAVYGRALSAQEIERLYREGLADSRQ